MAAKSAARQCLLAVAALLCSQLASGADGTAAATPPESSASPAAAQQGVCVEAWAWIKDTHWRWNEWEDVSFAANGSFVAPTPECAQGQCSWHGQDESALVSASQPACHANCRPVAPTAWQWPARLVNCEHP